MVRTVYRVYTTLNERENVYKEVAKVYRTDILLSQGGGMLKDTYSENEGRGDERMVIKQAGEEWVIKMGPISRTNQAKTMKHAEEGAVAQVEEGVKEIMEKVKPVVPLFLKGAMCAGECTPQVKEDLAEVTVVSYELNNGEWFSIASSGVFGVKLECKK